MTTPLPRAVMRALRLIEAHGSVLRVTATDPSSSGAVAVTVEMRTELPNAWRAAGCSPSGVRAVEPISFFFGSGYPASAPHITLRPDFDRSHPHIQPGDAGDPPEPCLVAGSPREVLRMRGIIGLIEQLAEWLERAAFVRLIDPEQGWEPTRRDHIDDVVIADAAWLTAMPNRNGGCNTFDFNYLAAVEDGGRAFYWATLAKSEPIALGSNFADTFQYRRGNGYRAGKGVALVAWAGKKPDGSPFIARTYKPETVSTVDGLLSRADELGMRAHLEPKLTLLQSRFSDAKMKAPVPLVVVLLARRPVTVIGTDSDVEICPYVVELSGGDALSPSSKKPVRPAAHRADIAVPLLKRASGDTDRSDSGWTLIGCGSVGSKIGLHMARAGRGPKVLVDRGNMQPHNYARHALYPNASGSDVAMSVPKAIGLAEVLNSLKQPAAAHTKDVVSHLISAKSLKPFADAETKFVLNTTGSASVRETLASLTPAEQRPRLAEACLLGMGEVGLFTLEGANANPSTTDLVCEAYLELHARKDLRERIFGRGATEIGIGQGCSAATLPLPDARVSMFAAPMADHLASLHRAELAAGGELLVGTLGSDGISLNWTKKAVAPRIVLKVGSGTEVRLSPAVDAAIKAEIQSRPRTETGGIVFGRYCDLSDTFHVVGTLPAPPDSKFSPEEFVLGTEGLRPLLSDLIEGSGGALYPLGTWHSHLVPSSPSIKDMRTAVLLSGMQFFPLLMLIRTPARYEVLTVETLKALPTVAADDNEQPELKDVGNAPSQQDQET